MSEKHQEKNKSEVSKILVTCPRCSREVKTEYKFCPNCGSQLSLSVDGILLAKLFGKVEPRTGVHNLAQQDSGQ